MEATARRTLTLPRVGTLRLDPAAFAAWLVPALLIVYLGLNNGGYDIGERSEVGIAVWWIVLVGTAVGVLPVAGGSRTGRAMLALLAAFAAWTALSLGWTESAERTSIEVARTATYLGVFALALAVQGQGRWRHLLHGVTLGLVAVCGIALLSRFEPTWFPEQETGRFIKGIEIERRLAYPLNYSTGLASLAALTLPLLLGATSSARTLIGQALAAAALPVAALAAWLTTSSISIPVVVIGLLAFLILAPDRAPKLGSLLIAGAGSGILIAASEQRDALDRGLPTPAAQVQGDEMLVIALVVCAGVALAQTGLGLAVRYGRRPSWLRFSPRQAAIMAGAALLVVALVGVAARGPQELSDRWENFKGRGGTAEVNEGRGSQILDVSSSGRYDFWQAARDQNETAPLIGTGPGTFEFWWARNGAYAGFVRDAHSLYLETLGELGIIGLVLIGGFSLALLGIGSYRALRAPPDLRVGLAAATAGCASFVASALVDWSWELAVLPVAFMCLAAVAIGAEPQPEPWSRSTRSRGPRPVWSRRARRNRGRFAAQLALIAVSVAALVLVTLPFAADDAVEDSRAAARDGQLDKALDEARDAVAIQPYSATPHLQEALVLDRLGEFGAATNAAREATRAESTNWRTWLILSRLQAERGDARASLNAYREARSLNPKSGNLEP